jgi:RNA recognition motif-containing protein
MAKFLLPKLLLRKFTQQSRGFGFVEMNDNEAAKQAMEALNGYDFMGKILSVNEARPKTDNGYSNNRGGSGGGGYKKPYGGGGNSGGGYGGGKRY